MAVRFDAAADRLLRTANLPSYDANYTMTAWIRLTSLGAGGYASVFVLNTDSTSTDYDWYGINRSGSTYRLTSVINNSEINGSVSIGVATWAFLAIVRSANNLRTIYRGNVTAAAVSDHTNTANVSSRSAISRMELGAWTTGNTDPYNGLVANIKIWTSALSLSEIIQAQQATRPYRFANLHGWWPCFAGAAERLRDYGANGYDWTAGGTLTDEAGPPRPWGFYTHPLRSVLTVAPAGQPTQHRTQGIPTGSGRRDRPGGWN